MSGGASAVRLASLGALRFTGPDALTFLQGQLSSDLMRLTAQHSQLAGYHNPQGRVIALLRLIALAQGDALAILPRELAGGVLERLARFRLRARVTLSDESAAWRIEGLIAAGTAALPEVVNEVVHQGSALVVRVTHAPSRWLRVSPMPESPANEHAQVVADEDRWRALGVAAGEPQVYAGTSGEFVAQMLNLDALGGIAFDKGCYTGQEVIARAHYRGRVKRRMQRFRTLNACSLAAADSGTLADGRAFRVVEAVALADGRCEFLAVAAVPGESGALSAPAHAALAVEELPLPYALPQ